MKRYDELVAEALEKAMKDIPPQQAVVLIAKAIVERAKPNHILGDPASELVAYAKVMAKFAERIELPIRPTSDTKPEGTAYVC